MSYNVCYFSKSRCVPIVFDSDLATDVLKSYALRTSSGHDFICVMYHRNGHYWYTISADWFKAVTSVPFVSFQNCERDFRASVRSFGWRIVMEGNRKVAA